MKYYFLLFCFIASSVICKADLFKDKLDKFIIPLNFFSLREGESGLLVYCPNQSKIVKPVTSNDTVSFDLHGRDGVVLELDRRDEEVWSQSVIAAWQITPFTQAIATRYDLRSRKKSTLRISNCPNNIDAVVFYKLSDSGVSDWVRIYEAVVNETLECDLLEAGVWICVPIDKNNTKLYNLLRILNIQEDAPILDFKSLSEGPLGIELEIKRAKFFSLKDVVE